MAVVMQKERTLQGLEVNLGDISINASQCALTISKIISDDASLHKRVLLISMN